MTTKTLATPSTLTDLFWTTRNSEKNHVRFRGAALAVGGSLVLALSAQLTIPFYPVPITGQTFAVFLIGLTYGSRLGAATMVLYLLEGLLGLPVFAGGAAGAAIFLLPSAGYLVGFVFAAYGLGWLAERGFDRTYGRLALAMLVGNVLLFVPGLLGLGFVLGWNQPILQMGLYPFLVGDVIKMALVILALPTAWKLVGRRNA